jgi:adenylate kinase
VTRDDCENGYILDGMPRSLAQAEELDRQGVGIDTVLSIEISDDEIETRLTGRRLCSGCGVAYHTEWNPPKAEGVCDGCGEALFIRSDDEPQTIRARLKAYHRETAPLKEYYKARGKLVTVDNINGVSETTAAIFKALGI